MGLKVAQLFKRLFALEFFDLVFHFLIVRYLLTNDARAFALGILYGVLHIEKIFDLDSG